MIGRLHIAVVSFAAVASWTIALSQETATVGASLAVFEKGLPAGWSVVERKGGEHPWGHHFCDAYSGPKGTKITVVGPNPVNVVWVSRTGESRQTAMAMESLEVWFMPPKYRDSRIASLCFSRPVQPVEIFSSSGVRVYGRPSHRLNSDAEFHRQVLDQAQAVSWPRSPENDRSTLSWTSWASDVEGALQAGVSK